VGCLFVMPGSAPLFASPVKEKRKPADFNSDSNSLHARGREFGANLLDNVTPGYVLRMPLPVLVVKAATPKLLRRSSVSSALLFALY
jgi:hypothetical protein